MSQVNELALYVWLEMKEVRQFLVEWMFIRDQHNSVRNRTTLGFSG